MTGIQWLEDGENIMQCKDTPTPTVPTQNYLAQNVNSAGVEKSFFKVTDTWFVLLPAY